MHPVSDEPPVDAVPPIATADDQSDLARDSAPEPDPVAPAEPSVVTRVMRRIVRRPVAWFHAPWTTERIVRLMVTIVVVGGSTWAATKVVQPSLVLSNKTVGLDAGRPDGGLLHIKLKWTGFRASADERLSLGMQPKHDAIRKVQAILRHQPGLAHATSATGNELASATSASSASELGPPECRHIRTGTGLAPATSDIGRANG